MFDELLNKKYIITITIKEVVEYKKIENCSLDELIDRLPNIDKDTIKLVYGYLHKSKLLTAYSYARHYNISESYLYKKVKEVKSKYDSLYKEEA